MTAPTPNELDALRAENIALRAVVETLASATPKRHKTGEKGPYWIPAAEFDRIKGMAICALEGDNTEPDPTPIPYDKGGIGWPVKQRNPWEMT